MIFLLLLLAGLWLAGAYPLWRMGWSGTSGWDACGPLSPPFLLRAVLRALPFAYLFSPAGIAAGFVGIPVPASLLLIGAILSHFADSKDSAAFAGPTILATASFSFCWSLFSVITYSVGTWRFLTRHPNWPGGGFLNYPTIAPPPSAFSADYKVADYIAKARTKQPRADLVRSGFLLGLILLGVVPTIYWVNRLALHW